MDFAFYQQLTEDALAGRMLDDETALRVLCDQTLDLIGLLHAAYAVRKAHHGNKVQVHILNNAQNGRCPEDCAYCAQARDSEVDITDYPLKSEQEILDEAKAAYESGAFRYCMVFAGRGPNDQRIATLARLIQRIKANWPLEVCVSPGLLDADKARVLAEAGLDRLNHNLNTSRTNYPNICTTHTYDDRLQTLQAARSAGLQVCSGLIAGMGEPPQDLIEVAKTLRQLQAESIPVNFLLPFEGGKMQPQSLSPRYCLRILCLFRLMNPKAELRCAAGREFHLRSMEVMCLYPANSLFMEGYLNSRGSARLNTLRMIREAGFEIVSDQPLDQLIDQADQAQSSNEQIELTINRRAAIKRKQELRPALREQ